MKIVYVIPGFGDTFYCQNCAYSMNLFDGMNRQKHTAVLAPMYMPVRMDIPVESDTPIFYGAINVYLEENYSLFRHIPLWLRNLLNSKMILEWVSKKSAPTNPVGLEEITISVMKGESGRHKRELDSMVSWLKNSIRPDIVHLANALLIGIAVKIKKELDIPVFCNLEDENFWLDTMREPYSSQGWDLIKKGADIIDGFISPSRYYADLIHSRIDIPADKVYLVSKGVSLKKFKPQTPSFDPPTIGFLSRMSKSNGLDILVDAFIMLKEYKAYKNLKLKITGGMSARDKKMIYSIKKKLMNRDLYKDVEIAPYLYQNDIATFYDSLTLTSVPARNGEAFGAFMLESMASGIPVVQPDIGAYPEIISHTGGGIVYENNNPSSFVQVISDLLDKPEKIIEMSKKGLNSVQAYYSAEKIIKDLLRIYNDKK